MANEALTPILSPDPNPLLTPILSGPQSSPKINFDLPDNTWSLDNTNRVPDLFELGRQAGEIEFDRVAENFFVKPKAQDYVPFTHEN